MKQINIQQLAAILTNHKGCTAVSIITCTQPKMRKTNNSFYGRVTRLASRSGMVGVSYENAVNNQRGREDIEEYFSADKLWNGLGRHISSALCEHTGTNEQYLVFYPTRTTGDGAPISNPDVWQLDGKDCDAETLSAIMSFVSEPSTPIKQGTDKMISWRTFKLTSIVQLKYMGEIYVIK